MVKWWHRSHSGAGSAFFLLQIVPLRKTLCQGIVDRIQTRAGQNLQSLGGQKVSWPVGRLPWTPGCINISRNSSKICDLKDLKMPRYELGCMAFTSGALLGMLQSCCRALGSFKNRPWLLRGFRHLWHFVGAACFEDCSFDLATQIVGEDGFKCPVPVVDLTLKFYLMPSHTNFTKCFISLYADEDTGNFWVCANIYQSIRWTKKY